MREPFRDTGEARMLRHADEDLGETTMAHVIGARPDPERARALGAVHGELCRPDQVERIERLGGSAHKRGLIHAVGHRA
jgi:hypothetical protein